MEHLSDRYLGLIKATSLLASPKQEFLFRSEIGVINIPEQIHLYSASPPAAAWSHIKGLMKSRTYRPHSALLLS
jgi:hypothetical protein